MIEDGVEIGVVPAGHQTIRGDADPGGGLLAQQHGTDGDRDEIEQGVAPGSLDSGIRQLRDVVTQIATGQTRLHGGPPGR